MGGKQEALSDYIERLAGRRGAVLEDLSSAKRARLVSWAKENGVDIAKALSVTKTSENSDQPKKFELKGRASDEDFSFGFGIDIQVIDELDIPTKDWKTSEEFLHIFTEREIAYCETQRDPVETFAGLFAAKEAMFKAMGSNHEGYFADWEVKHDSEGKPFSDICQISISHSGGFAVAVAVCPVDSFSRSGQKIVREIETQESAEPIYAKLVTTANFWLPLIVGFLGGVLGSLFF